MSLINNNVCDQCNTRVPKNRPKLTCSLCNLTKHYRCQTLSKADAYTIIRSSSYQWTCYECLSGTLPVNVCTVSRNRSNNSNTVPVPRFNTKCHSCDGQSYSVNNVSSCPWCDELCHNKCINSSLGCNKCCDYMIPGFRVHNYELYGTAGFTNNYIYNPYSSSNNVNLIGDTITNEAENNSCWNEISDFLIKCKYKQLKHVTVPKNNELNVLSLNIRSLNKNVQIINDNAFEFQKYDVLCFNETNCNLDKLPNGIDDLNIEGFHPPIIQAPARSSCRGGGLATYVNKRVCSAEECVKLDIVPETVTDGEFLFLKIVNCKSSNKSVIIGNIYRSPSRKPCQFIESFEAILHKLTRHSNKHVLIVGDFNVDLIKHETDINSQNLIDATSNVGYIQVISRPTRVTDHSATLIDHIYTNKINNVLSSDIVTLDLSDHLATSVKISLDGVFDNVQRPHNRRNDAEKCEYRMFNEANDETFKCLIADETWDIPDNMDAEAKYNMFIDLYTKHYNTAYPLNTNRKRRKHERARPKPWILPWLEDACNRKNGLYYTFVKNPTAANKTRYLKMKKFVEKHIKIAKGKYYKKYFEQYKDNSKKQWNMINSLLNRNTKKAGVSRLQVNNGNILNTPQAIAEKFNEYFSNIASNLKTQISDRNTHDSSKFTEFLSRPVANSIIIKPVVAVEISEIIKNLKNKATLDTKVNPLNIWRTWRNILLLILNEPPNTVRNVRNAERKCRRTRTR